MITKTYRSLITLMITGMLGTLIFPCFAATDNGANPAPLLAPLAESGNRSAAETQLSTAKITLMPKYIPEPSTSLLGALGILIIFRRRRE